RGLKVIDMVVHAPQPSLEVHDDSVQVREISPFFARRYAREVLELLLQGGRSGPLVGGHFGLLAYVVSHKSTQLQGTSLGYNPGVKARDPFPFFSMPTTTSFFFLFFLPRTPSSWPPKTVSSTSASPVMGWSSELFIAFMTLRLKAQQVVCPRDSLRASSVEVMPFLLVETR